MDQGCWEQGITDQSGTDYGVKDPGVVPQMTLELMKRKSSFEQCVPLDYEEIGVQDLYSGLLRV